MLRCEIMKVLTRLFSCGQIIGGKLRPEITRLAEMRAFFIFGPRQNAAFNRYHY